MSSLKGQHILGDISVHSASAQWSQLLAGQMGGYSPGDSDA